MIYKNFYSTVPAYSFSDYVIMPEFISYIEHRKQCYIEQIDKSLPASIEDMLPIFNAPMTSIVNENNYKVFNNNKINTIIPRSTLLKHRLSLADKTFVAMSLDEICDLYQNILDGKFLINDRIYICIDVANGHMIKIFKIINKIKTHPIFANKIIIMSGNIANPNTYKAYCKYKCDFVRLGIGGGSACTTSVQTGIHFPLASLLIETNKIKENLKKKKKFYTKIIVDGGISNTADIIKAFAMGSDYVMLGKILVKTYEACGEIFNKEQSEKNNSLVFLNKKDTDKDLITNKVLNKNWYRLYYGMSTEKAQKEIAYATINSTELDNKSESNLLLKNPEGIQYDIQVEYTLDNWIKNIFTPALQSAMSYCDATTLQEFYYNSTIILISPNSYHYFKK